MVPTHWTAARKKLASGPASCFHCSPLALAAALCGYLASRASDGLTGRLIAAPWDPWPFSPEQRQEIAESDIYALRRIVPKDRGKTWGDR